MTLDGQEHQLSADDLMICDGRKAVALAGVMGGLNSEVLDDTETILLEAAYFNPVTVRRTSKRHGLHTESSHRFERGADIDMVPVAEGLSAWRWQLPEKSKIIATDRDNAPKNENEGAAA